MLDAGGVIVEILATRSGAPATRADLTTWVNNYRLPVTSLVDRPGTGTVTLNTYGIRESAFIVDLATMRVVRKFNGSVAGVGASAIAQAIPEMLRLLGR